MNRQFELLHRIGMSGFFGGGWCGDFELRLPILYYYVENVSFSNISKY